MKTLRISFISAAMLSAGLFCQGGGGTTASTVGEPDSGNLRTFVELVRKDIRSEKAIILAQDIDFTRDEAVDYWPIYSENELYLSKLYERSLSVVKGYNDKQDLLTDEQERKRACETFS